MTLVLAMLGLIAAAVLALAVVIGRNPPGRKRDGCGGAPDWRAKR